MRITSVLLVLLTAAPVAAQEKIIPCETEAGRGYFYNDTDMGMDGCPTVEKALRLVKENPLAYRMGKPECRGLFVFPEGQGSVPTDCTGVDSYDWYDLNMAREILRQGYAPVVVFSKAEQDALADELVQLYLHGTDEQAHLALSVLRNAGGRYYDRLYEIVETLTDGPPDVLACLAYGPCSNTARSRAISALRYIKDHRGQQGQE